MYIQLVQSQIQVLGLQRRGMKGNVLLVHNVPEQADENCEIRNFEKKRRMASQWILSASMSAERNSPLVPDQ